MDRPGVLTDGRTVIHQTAQDIPSLLMKEIPIFICSHTNCFNTNCSLMAKPCWLNETTGFWNLKHSGFKLSTVEYNQMQQFEFYLITAMNFCFSLPIPSIINWSKLVSIDISHCLIYLSIQKKTIATHKVSKKLLNFWYYANKLEIIINLCHNILSGDHKYCRVSCYNISNYQLPCVCCICTMHQAASPLSVSVWRMNKFSIGNRPDLFQRN